MTLTQNKNPKIIPKMDSKRKSGNYIMYNNYLSTYKWKLMDIIVLGYETKIGYFQKEEMSLMLTSHFELNICQAKCFSWRDRSDFFFLHFFNSIIMIDTNNKLQYSLLDCQWLNFGWTSQIFTTYSNGINKG